MENNSEAWKELKLSDGLYDFKAIHIFLQADAPKVGKGKEEHMEDVFTVYFDKTRYHAVIIILDGYSLNLK